MAKLSPLKGFSLIKKSKPVCHIYGRPVSTIHYRTLSRAAILINSVLRIKIGPSLHPVIGISIALESTNIVNLVEPAILE